MLIRFYWDGGFVGIIMLVFIYIVYGWMVYFVCDVFIDFLEVNFKKLLFLGLFIWGFLNEILFMYCLLF